MYYLFGNTMGCMSSQTLTSNPVLDDRYQISEAQIQTYREDGFVKLDGVFDKSEVAALREENDRIINGLATKHLQETSPIKTSDHVFQSGLWGQVVRDQRLVSPVSQLIGPNVEFHHTNARKWMPSEQSHRELHQDRVFYPHESTNFVNALIHLDDFPDEEGTMRFIPGSHKDGNLGHIEGENGLPQLPAEDYEFKDSVKVSAEAGDMILMHINVVHGSEIDRATAGNIVWIGYNDPSNQQLSGQAADREGFIVAGHRPK